MERNSSAMQPTAGQEPPAGELVRQLSEQVSVLVRDELKLARPEMIGKGSQAGLGVGMLVSVLGGVIAGAIFKRAWKVPAGEDDVPKATDAQRGWREALLAAALQGAIFGLVKVVIDRAAAEGTRRLTGAWPGENDGPSGKGA
jgi:uncharacterized protein DUF4235/putative superfamily III holin-X